MSILWALVAFAGAMAVLSTVVSVLVEGCHKFFLVRRSGLEEMLRALYAAEVVRNKKDYATTDAAAHAPRAFARAMTRVPSRHDRGWYARRIPVIAWLIHGRFERLSTLQFAEQLANSPIGDRLATKNRDQIKHELVALAYQFERLGEAQSDYFKRRAKVLSVTVAIAFAMCANIDAIALFSTFLRDQTAASTLISRVEGHDFDKLLADTRTSLDRVDASLNARDLPAGAMVVDPAAAAVAADRQALLKNDVAALRQTVEAIQSDSQALSQLGIPIGATMFPVCENPPKSTAGAQTAYFTDHRCRNEALHLPVVNPAALPFTSGASKASPAKLITFEKVDPKANAPDTPARVFFARLFSRDGLLWLFGTLAAAGLLGLGAPFWFDIFRRLATISAPMKALSGGARSGDAAAAGGDRPQPSTRAPTVRDTRSVDPETLYRGFALARGGPLADMADPPRGRRLGPSSASAGLAIEPLPGDAGAPMRRLR